MAEELLDLAEVRAGVQKLGGKHVAERVRRDALARVHARRVDVAAEQLAELRLGKSPALDADEERLFDDRLADAEVVGDKRAEGGVDGDDALAAALGVADAQEAAVQVDVVPIEAEQLGPAEAGVGEEGEQEPVALALAVVLAVPPARSGARMSRLSSARSRTSGSASRFFGVRRTSAGSRSSHSDSRQKRKNPFSAATVRIWLDAAGRRSASSARTRAGRAVARPTRTRSPPRGGRRDRRPRRARTRGRSTRTAAARDGSSAQSPRLLDPIRSS